MIREIQYAQLERENFRLRDENLKLSQVLVSVLTSIGITECMAIGDGASVLGEQVTRLKARIEELESARRGREFGDN